MTYACAWESPFEFKACSTVSKSRGACNIMGQNQEEIRIADTLTNNLLHRRFLNTPITTPSQLSGVRHEIHKHVVPPPCSRRLFPGTGEHPGGTLYTAQWPDGHSPSGQIGSDCGSEHLVPCGLCK